MFRFHHFHRASLAGLSFSLALACAQLSCSKATRTTEPFDEPVAIVNGTTITLAEIDMVAKRSLGELAIGSVQRAAYPRLVDAAVRSRAISMAAEHELSEVDKKSLERELAAYREQLLVRQYLSRHNPPKPVTTEMALHYYKHYPERFGGGMERRYELVGATRALSSDERTRLLAKLSDSTAQRDWKQWSDELQKSGYPVTFLAATSGDKVLHPKLRTLLDGLKNGTDSPVVFIEGRPYVGRVAGEDTRAPKPFDTVREEIERLLVPAQVSVAVEQAAQDVLKSSKVEILNLPQTSPSAPPPKAVKP
jgi:hypothetical protein